MAIHKNIISTKAKKGDLNPKNKKDHNILKASCKIKTIIAILTFLSLNPILKIKYKEIPINKNKIVQTGAKTQFGGVNEGLFIFAYQPGIEGVVNKEPIRPAN